MPKEKSSFQSLLGELEELDTNLAKAFPDEDGTDGGGDDDGQDGQDGQGASGDGGEGGSGAGGEGGSDGGAGAGGGGGGEADDGDDKDMEEMAKSLGLTPMEIVGDDGTKQRAYDGMQALKALHKRMEGFGSADEMLKAMEIVGSATSRLMGHVKKQDQVIKTLQEQVVALSAGGKGRKAVLHTLDKSLRDGGGEDDGRVDAADVMAKAQAAVGKGMLSGAEMANVERCLNSGQLPGDQIMQKINQA